MNKTFISFLVICSFSLMVSTVASEVDQCYDKYKKQILDETFFIQGKYLFVIGKAKIHSSSVSSFTMAQKTALISLERNIAKIRLQNPELEKSNINFSALKNIIFDSWLSLANLKYTIKNRIDIDKFSKSGYFYHVAAYKLSDIEFEDKTPVTWERIYSDFKNNPGKRDELLFFEIIPDRDLPALISTVEDNITKQYGKNFALMFMGNDVPPIPKKRYDIAKKASEKYNSKTSLKILIIAANTLPYDKNICTLLAEKFDEMQMPRCSAIMKKRAEESKKLIIEPEPAVSAPEVKNTADTKEIKMPRESKKAEQNPRAETSPRKAVAPVKTVSDDKSGNEKKAVSSQPAPNINFVNLL